MFGNTTGQPSQWISRVSLHVRQGKPVGEHLAAMENRSGTIENILRVREGLQTLPEKLRDAAGQLIGKSVGSQTGLSVLRKATLGQEITHRLRTDPRLQATDTQHIQSSFERYIALDTEKKSATRQAALHLWGSRQKDRLLAMTGSRLNGTGAELKRRFTLRGERAMRLRQVVAIGSKETDGDPLFDLRPVWMASPETVGRFSPAARCSTSSSSTKPRSVVLKKHCPCFSGPIASSSAIRVEVDENIT